MMNAEKIAACTGTNADQVRNFVPQLVSVMKAYEINTPERQAAFLALVIDDGGGLIKLDGRTGHVGLTNRLRAKFPDLNVPDFHADPGALSVPVWAARAAGDLWALKNLNRAADAGDLMRCAQEMRGSAKGYAARLANCERGKRELGA